MSILWIPFVALLRWVKILKTKPKLPLAPGPAACSVTLLCYDWIISILTQFWLVRCTAWRQHSDQNSKSSELMFRRYRSAKMFLFLLHRLQNWYFRLFPRRWVTRSRRCCRRWRASCRGWPIWRTRASAGGSPCSVAACSTPAPPTSPPSRLSGWALTSCTCSARRRRGCH